jgi:hypothetical protein
MMEIIDGRLIYSYFNKVVHEKSGKVEYERERMLGIAKKLMRFPAAFRARIRLFFPY